MPKVVAIGDLHGSYDKLVQLLEGAELVDEGLRWAGGEAGLGAISISAPQIRFARSAGFWLTRVVP